MLLTGQVVFTNSNLAEKIDYTQIIGQQKPLS